MYKRQVQYFLSKACPRTTRCWKQKWKLKAKFKLKAHKCGHSNMRADRFSEILCPILTRCKTSWTSPIGAEESPYCSLFSVTVTTTFKACDVYLYTAVPCMWLKPYLHCRFISAHTHTVYMFVCCGVSVLVCVYITVSLHILADCMYYVNFLIWLYLFLIKSEKIFNIHYIKINLTVTLIDKCFCWYFWSKSLSVIS